MKNKSFCPEGNIVILLHEPQRGQPFLEHNSILSPLLSVVTRYKQESLMRCLSSLYECPLKQICSYSFFQCWHLYLVPRIFNWWSPPSPFAFTGLLLIVACTRLIQHRCYHIIINIQVTTAMSSMCLWWTSCNPWSINTPISPSSNSTNCDFRSCEWDGNF
jgi:hypothetical protein